MHPSTYQQPTQRPSALSANTEQVQPVFVSLGTIGSSAPEAALLAALQALRPGWEVRLRSASDVRAETPTYVVEVRTDHSAASGSIDVWLQLKSALMAAFPADKPDAVTAWDA